MTLTIIISAVCLFLGLALGYLLFRYIIKQKYEQTLKEAEIQAETIKKNKLLEVKEKFINKKAELEKEVSQRNQRLQQAENKLKQRELSLNQRHEDLQRKKAETEKLQENLERQTKLIDQKKLGRKAGEGLYKLVRNDSGDKRLLVYDIKAGIYRDVINYSFPFALEMKKYLKVGEYDNALRVLIENHSQEADICLRFLLRYIVYALYTAEHVGYDLKVADDVMATGFTWCPPFAMMDAFSNVCDLALLMKTRLKPEIVTQVDIDHIIAEHQRSKYDYRPFFKAK